MARFTLLIAALAATVFADKAVEVPAAVANCPTVAHLQALGHTYSSLNTTGEHKLPEIPKHYLEHPTECIPESLFEKYFEPVVAVSKEHKLMDTFGQTVHSRDVEVFKRARSCPDIKAAAIGKKNTYSCVSASNPSACESCANFSAANFIVACAACIAKNNAESPFCCAAAATAFLTYYTQTCLEK